MDDLTLYGMSEELLALDEMLEMDEGEISEDFEKLRADLIPLIEKKVDGCCGYIQKLKDLAASARDQKKRLDIFIRQKENKIERFSQYIKFCMDHTGKDVFMGELFEIKMRKPAQILQIVDESFVPLEFTEAVKTIKIDKAALKKAVKSGAVDIKGIELVDGKQSISFKLRTETKREKTDESRADSN